MIGYLDWAGEFIQLGGAELSNGWTHVIGTERHLVFYAAYSGHAATGFITSDGKYIPQQAYLS